MGNTRTPRTVRLTDSEVAELRAVAQPLGIGWTQFLRWAALTAMRKLDSGEVLPLNQDGLAPDAPGKQTVV